MKIGRRICVDASAFKSVQRFEEEKVKRLPCVGIFEWRGVIKTNPKRTHFDIESKVERLLSFHDMGALFSAKLLRVARDFIEQHLTSNFISVHIRTAEKFYVLEEIFPQSRGVFFRLRKRLQRKVCAYISHFHTPLYYLTYCKKQQWPTSIKIDNIDLTYQFSLSIFTDFRYESIKSLDCYHFLSIPIFID